MIKFLIPHIQNKRLVLSALFLLGMTSLSQASFVEESDSSFQTQKKENLEKWELKREDARNAFRPVLKSLKYLGDEKAYQEVSKREGEKFLGFVREQAILGWKEQKVVMDYLRDLYGAHTSLINTHAELQELLKSALSSIEREQGVSNDLRVLLKEKKSLFRDLEKQLLEAKSSALHSSDDVLIDLESQRPTESSSLLPKDSASENCMTPLYTKIFYSSVGVVVGAGLTFLATYLYSKYQH